MDRHWDENTKGVAGSNPTGGKRFAQINLPFTIYIKQYKNDNIANFV